MTHKTTLALTLALVACSSTIQGEDEANLTTRPKASFETVRAKVYASPQTELPSYRGLSSLDIVKNLVGSEDKPKHELSIRSRRTLVDQSDERPAAPKLLHTHGACAEGTWSIDQASAATGLFEQGVSVPAIVRMSTGTPESANPRLTETNRIFGMAVKLFPTTLKTQAVRTRNIIMLDQYGFERASRARTFFEDDGAPVYFTNVAPAKSAVGKFLSTFFDRFDQPNWARPLYASARANIGGGNLIEYTSPYEIRFRARPEQAREQPKLDYPDFRSELQAVSGVTLDIVLQSFHPTQVVEKTIGKLTLGKFVVSEYCDLSLHFHHDAIEDQLEKYSDYEVVRDLMPDDY
jgi:hypothetical protein